MDYGYADWVEAKRVFVQLMRDTFGAAASDETYDRVAGAYQARLASLPDPMLIARMSDIKDDEPDPDDTREIVLPPSREWEAYCRQEIVPLVAAG